MRFALSVAAYARRRGVHPRTVRRWLAEERKLPEVVEVTRTVGGHFRLWVSERLTRGGSVSHV